MHLRFPANLELARARMVRGPIGRQYHRPPTFGLSYWRLDLPIKPGRVASCPLGSHDARYMQRGASAHHLLSSHRMERSQEARELCGPAFIARLRPRVHQQYVYPHTWRLCDFDALEIEGSLGFSY